MALLQACEVVDTQHLSVPARHPSLSPLPRSKCCVCCSHRCDSLALSLHLTAQHRPPVHLLPFYRCTTH